MFVDLVKASQVKLACSGCRCVLVHAGEGAGAMADSVQPKAKKEIESRFVSPTSAIIGTEPRFAPIDPGENKGITARRVGQDVSSR